MAVEVVFTCADEKVCEDNDVVIFIDARMKYAVAKRNKAGKE